MIKEFAVEKRRPEQHYNGPLLKEAKKLDPNEERSLTEEGMTGYEPMCPEY